MREEGRKGGEWMFILPNVHFDPIYLPYVLFHSYFPFTSLGCSLQQSQH